MFCAGFFCIRYADLLMKDEAKNIYQDILSQTNESPKLKWQVCLQNNHQYVPNLCILCFDKLAW